jgi:phage shock protein B
VQPQEAVMGMFAIFAVFIAFPYIVLNFLSRRRDSEVKAAGDPNLNALLNGIADKMEKRLDAIEILLDHEVPGWRGDAQRRAP